MTGVGRHAPGARGRIECATLAAGQAAEAQRHGMRIGRVGPETEDCTPRTGSETKML